MTQKKTLLIVYFFFNQSVYGSINAESQQETLQIFSLRERAAKMSVIKGKFKHYNNVL